MRAPQRLGLGTRDRPYIESPNLRRIELVGILSDTESVERSNTQISAIEAPTTDPIEDEAFEEAKRELKALQLGTEETEIEQDEPTSQVATRTNVASVAYTGVPQPVSFQRAAIQARGQVGSTAARSGDSAISASGTTGGASSTVPPTSGVVTGGSASGGATDQLPSAPGGQQGTGAHTGGGTGPPQGDPPAGGGGSGGGAGSPAPQPAAPAVAAQAGPVPAANGAMRGHPPEIFRRKSERKPTTTGITPSR